LLSEPAFGLVVVTLRTTAVAAGVIGIDFPAAMVALMNMASEKRRATVLDIPQCFLLRSGQLIAELGQKGFAVEGDDVSHLQQGTSTG
jgi:hypothetical protein